MRVFRCDRCGAEQNLSTAVTFGRVLDPFGSEMAGLCKGCLHALTEWLKITSDV